MEGLAAGCSEGLAWELVDCSIQRRALACPSFGAGVLARIIGGWLKKPESVTAPVGSSTRSWYSGGGRPAPASANSESYFQLGTSGTAGGCTQLLPRQVPSPWHGDASTQT